MLSVKRLFYIFIIITSFLIANQSFAQWTQCNGPYGADIQCISFNKGTIYAGTNGSGIFISMDYGKNWLKKNNGLANKYVNSIAISGNNIFAGTNSGIYLSSDSCNTWKNISSPELNGKKIFSMATNGTNIYIGAESKLFFTSDNGNTWLDKSNGINDTVWCISIDGSDIYIGYNKRRIVKSNDNCNTWSWSSEIQWYSFDEYHIRSFIKMGMYLFAATDGGGVFVSTDNGVKWVESNSGLNNLDIRQIVRIYSRIFVVSYGGGVFLTTNTGLNWERVNNGLSNLNSTCITVDNNNLFIGTTGGVYLSTNYGSKWEVVNNGINGYRINSIKSIGTSVFAATNGAGIYVSNDNGVSWTEKNEDLKNFFVNCLAFYGSSLLAGTSQGTFLLNDTDSIWGNIFQEVNYQVYCIYIDNSDAFVGTYYGIYKFINNLEKWIYNEHDGYGLTRTIARNGSNLFYGTWGYGVYLLTNERGYFVDVNQGITNLYINSLILNGSDVLAGSQGGVFKSTNNGSSWVPSNFGLTDSIINNLFFNDNIIYTGTTKGIFVSTNFGDNWVSVNDGIGENSVLSIDIQDTNIYIGTMANSVYKRSLPELLSTIKGFYFTTTGDISICYGDSATIGIRSVKNGNYPFNYKWSSIDGQFFRTDSMITVSPSSTTIYKVIVLDKNQNIDSALLKVIVNPKPTNPKVKNEYINVGESAKLIALNPGNYQFNWYYSILDEDPLFIGDTLITPKLDKTTNYFVESIDLGTQCKSQRISVTVTVIGKEFYASSLGDKLLCNGDSVQIGISGIFNGKYPYKYEWSPPDGLNTTTDSITKASPNETTIYQLIVTDSDQNSDTIQTKVTISPKPIEPIISDKAVDFGEGTSLSVSGPLGCIFYWYQSQSGDSIIHIGNSFVTPNLNETTYYYLESEDNITKCRSSRKKVSVYVKGKELIAITSGDKVICSGEKVPIGIESISNGKYPFTFSWSPSEGLNSSIDSVVIASPDKTTDYQLVVTDNNGLKDTIIIKVSVNPLPIPLAIDTIAIEGDIALLSATQPAGCTFRWFDSPISGNLVFIGNQLSVTAINDTIFYLEAEDNITGCKSNPRKLVKLTIEKLNPIELTSLGTTFEICKGQSVEIGITDINGGKAPYTFKWDPIAGLDKTNEMKVIASPQSTTLYTLTVIDSRNLVKKLNITVSVNSIPPEAVLKVPFIQQNPKDVIKDKSIIPVILESGSIINHPCIKTDSLFIQLSMNRNLFFPAIGTIWSHDGDRLYMQQIIKLSDLQLNTTLMEFKGTILLGDTVETDITIDSVRWIGGNVQTTTENGKLELIGVHEVDGKKRLLKFNWSPKITKINPNPTNDEIEIGIESLEDTINELEIINTLGFEVDKIELKLIKGNNIIKYKFNEFLNGGAYIVRLHNSLNNYSQVILFR